MFTSVITPHPIFSFFFFNDTATTEIYTLSLHDALPIFLRARSPRYRHHLAVEFEIDLCVRQKACLLPDFRRNGHLAFRSEEHTSELQSHSDLVCRLLLEKKKI